ncbi:helix-turn-helix protein [Actinomadura pelletieri DSM 43383]|uniref:Helix-turn-helix protein n=1 Tax=Actinomadura pelletieri DSM 43383 TaxID=1120940 RepID=A0A495QKZ5_9ACTN|nr:helix-turn-helix transcriptional regulator [Actinomadura pelletieri]RKS73193.1 helix-turn-helix protein [Actinomadura pelletieri DSM 43383]
MSSPFVRRRRLATDLRTLREQRGLTADDVAGRIYRSRMMISKLENARCRPDIGVVMKFLDVLEPPADQYQNIVTIARDAAERGWWDAYGDTMGARQRMYADIESGAATIRGYNQFGLPGILQTPRFALALVELDKADGPLAYHPDRMLEARLRRQEAGFGPSGPNYELVLDEFVIRRLAVPTDVMGAQLMHLVETATAEPRLTIHVLPINARIEGGFLARSTFAIYTFPDPQDHPIAIADTVNADLVHTETSEVTRYVELYKRLRTASLSPVRSLTFLEDVANELRDLAGS